MEVLSESINEDTCGSVQRFDEPDEVVRVDVGMGVNTLVVSAGVNGDGVSVVMNVDVARKSGVGVRSVAVGDAHAVTTAVSRVNPIKSAENILVCILFSSSVIISLIVLQ